MWEHNFEHFHIGQSESIISGRCFFTTKCGRCPDLLSTSLAFTDPGEGHIVFCPQTSFSALLNMFLRMSPESWQASTLNCFPQIVRRKLSEDEAVLAVERLEDFPVLILGFHKCKVPYLFQISLTLSLRHRRPPC